jgi:hypothetical protein
MKDTGLARQDRVRFSSRLFTERISKIGPKLDAKALTLSLHATVPEPLASRSSARKNIVGHILHTNFFTKEFN